MALYRFKVSYATYGDVSLSDAEVAWVVDDPIVGNIGFWTADGTLDDVHAKLRREGKLVAENELGAVVEGDAMLQRIRGRHGNPIHLTGRGPLHGVPPREA
jgi:hypothetical protein